jgi:hypothetical protein
MKDKVRPIYSELQGCLAQAPEEANTSDAIYESSIWIHFNELVDMLGETTEKDYSRFRILPTENNSFIRVIVYRQKLGALIARLHGEYFSDETAPFSGMPSTIIHQTQTQSQTIEIQMLLDVGAKIEQELPKHEDGSDKKKFLQKVKESLRGIKTAAQFINKILSVGNEFGITPDDISKLLGV